MILTLLSAIFGGALRVVPAILSYLGQGQQNAHELAMQDKQLMFLQVQGKLKTDEIAAQDAAVVDAALAERADQRYEDPLDGCVGSGRQGRHGGVGAHAPGIRSLVEIERSLVILR